MSSEIIKSLVSCNRSELVNLFEASHKAALFDNINSLKEEHPSDPIIGLLWCHVQAETGAIPLSFIAGTILEKFAKPEVFNNAIDLCYTVFKNIAEHLQLEDEHRLCLLILEPLYKSLSLVEDKNKIKSLLQISLSAEQAEAPKRKEGKAYIEYIHELKNSLVDNFIIAGIEQNNSKLSTETLLSEPISDLMDHSHRIKKVKETLPENKNSKMIYVIFITALLLIFLAREQLQLYYKTLEDKALTLFTSRSKGTLYSLNINSETSEPYLPSLPPYSVIEKDSHLDSISERLSNLHTEATSESTSTPITTPTTTKTEIDKEEIESLNVIPEGKDNIPLKKVPSLAISQVPPPVDLGNSNKGAPVERALDGSPLKSYEVEKFDPPELYFTITSTNVLSAPSLMAESVARIETKTTVRVTSIMGQWAEIRSNAGRLGYVFLKDLEKEEKSLD